MQEFVFSGILGAILIILCSLVTYELLRIIWHVLPRLQSPPRVRIFLVVCGIFAGHIINIWMFGFVYFMLEKFKLGFFTGSALERGEFTMDIFGCLYFSAVTYTTLGLGDITPGGALRMIAGVEGLAGFIMIGWTVTFTYLAMEKFWEMPHRRGIFHLPENNVPPK